MIAPERSPLKSALITPCYLQSTVGNAVTVRRIESSLRKLGCEVEVFSLDAMGVKEIAERVTAFSPDVVHAFHAIHCGAIAMEAAKELSIPYVVGITGTDIYSESSFSAVVEREILDNASALIVFHEDVGKRLAELVPSMGGRITVIPQGVTLAAEEGEESGSSLFTFFFPAGLRPVKNNLFPFKPIEQLWHSYPQVRLVLAGPVLEILYTEEVMESVAAHPFASWLGEVDHAEMPILYRECQVILNCSISEGGMANSLLEGMAHAKAVLVSDVEGNRSLVTDGVNGLLFASEEEFIAKAERLIVDSEFRKKLGSQGQSYVRQNCSPENEARVCLDLYMKIKNGEL
ncbi:MAG: glycosyltransferase family 4 protein [Geobacteraceae bacterium]|nr:glycosyltransferase family 4 protein [Geobacteraceae bacterium]